MNNNEDKARILVVDDELGMREGCKKVLNSEGYEVETAEDGISGLELFRERKNYSAAIVDIKMPRMGGIELIKRIHEIDEDAILLVITAYSTINSAVEATKRGAYGYIPKPFTPDELLIPVKKGLEKRALILEARRLHEEKEKRLLEIASERSRANTIIRCMTDGVIVVNMDRQIVLHNTAAITIIPEFKNSQLPAPVAGIRCAELQDLLNKALSTDIVPQITSKQVAIGEHTYMVNVSQIVDEKMFISGAVAVLRNITELKKLESAKSMFVSMVAHEIKSPLAAVESYLNVILNDMVSGDPMSEKRMIERSLVRIRTLREMVMELMNITAMETGNFTIKRSPIDIYDVVYEVMESCREKAEEKTIALSINCRDHNDKMKVLADRDAMTIVINNLIDNAIKYTPKNGHAQITIERNGIHARIKIKDDGIGMTSQEKERAFDEFFRAKNKFTEKVPGTGLGLSLVRRLIEMHQGSIDLETAPNKGSTFTVSIPLVK